MYITKGLTGNEKLVVTDIAAPVEGMPLRIATAQDENEGGGESLEEQSVAARAKRQELAEGGQR